jgi:hypothetical protein
MRQNSSERIKCLQISHGINNASATTTPNTNSNERIIAMAPCPEPDPKGMALEDVNSHDHRSKYWIWRGFRS